jgi:hypothetical protein
MRDGEPMKLTGIPVRKPHENDAIPKIAPKWLKHDKQVRKKLVTVIGPAFPRLLPGASR